MKSSTVQDNALVSVIDSPDFNTTIESLALAKLEHSDGFKTTRPSRGVNATWSNDIGTEMSTARTGQGPLSFNGTF